jgi:hypothetical protein
LRGGLLPFGGALAWLWCAAQHSMPFPYAFMKIGVHGLQLGLAAQHGTSIHPAIHQRQQQHMAVRRAFVIVDNRANDGRLKIVLSPFNRVIEKILMTDCRFRRQAEDNFKGAYRILAHRFDVRIFHQ